MIDYLENQRQNLSEVLDQYHKEQMDMIEAMDKELMKEVERRNCPSSVIIIISQNISSDFCLKNKRS